MSFDRFGWMARFKEPIWWGLGIGLAIGSTFFGGYDWLVYYHPQAREIRPEFLNNPLWIFLLLGPIARLPPLLSFVVFSFINLAIFWWVSRFRRVNPYLILISFPAFWVIWYGQLDAFVLLGITLGIFGLRARRDWVIALSILLLLVKPHLGLFPAIYFFLAHRRWQVLIYIAAVSALTVLIWGVNWPLVWVANLLQAPEDIFVDQKINISLFPYGLLAWLLLLLPLESSARIKAILTATFLSIPYMPAYSLLAYFAFRLPWWAYIAISLPLIFGQKGYPWTVLAPLGIGLGLVIEFGPVRFREFIGRFRGPGSAAEG